MLGGMAGAGAALVAGGVPARLARAALTGPVPLPSPADVRRDFQRMVDFGPRLTGTTAHVNFIKWLEQGFVDAGLELLPCDVYQTQRWEAQQVGLEILGGTAAGRHRVAAYYPRSQETPANGVTGPLVYGGALPAPALDPGAGPAGVLAAATAYPGQVSSWAAGLTGTIAGGTAGSILLVDLPAPPAMTTAMFAPLATDYHWTGHSLAEWLTAPYQRTWLIPGVAAPPLSPFQALGAVGVVFILDVSYAALKGTYAPFENAFEPLPAIYVDRDTGASLRAAAAARPDSRLTLTAKRQTVPAPTVTAVLRGESDETIIFNTHTDGEGFVEENGPVAFVLLARHFASLPKAQRLKRTLVFACWPGHMSADLPQGRGWIDAHPDLVHRAAAALTIEHLGCTDWEDTASGYVSTGLPEAFAVWVTRGAMHDLALASVVDIDLPRTVLCRPPAQFGVGLVFQEFGVPQVGAIAGPSYLLTISPNGDMDKLDEALAAKQIAWVADLARRIDPVPAATLRQGDPTLGIGQQSPPAANEDHTKMNCAPPPSSTTSAPVPAAGPGLPDTATDVSVAAVAAAGALGAAAALVGPATICRPCPSGASSNDD